MFIIHHHHKIAYYFFKFYVDFINICFYLSLIISVIRTPKLSSITTTSPFATFLPFTRMSIGSPAILFSSTIVPGANSRISLIDFYVLPNSTVTSNGTSLIKSMFSCCVIAFKSPENGWNVAGCTLTFGCGAYPAGWA